MYGGTSKLLVQSGVIYGKEDCGIEMKDEILNRLGRKCKSCGTKENLHIHHKLPYWLWRYVGETDKDIGFSIRFIDNYEVVCRDCHHKRHAFLNRHLASGFKWHYVFKLRWRPPSYRNSFLYTVVVADDYWSIGTY